MGEKPWQPPMAGVAEREAEKIIVTHPAAQGTHIFTFGEGDWKEDEDLFFQGKHRTKHGDIKLRKVPVLLWGIDGHGYVTPITLQGIYDWRDRRSSIRHPDGMCQTIDDTYIDMDAAVVGIRAQIASEDRSGSRDA